MGAITAAKHGLAAREPNSNGDAAGFQDASAILRFALTGTLKGKTAVLSSFGTESAVLLHLVAQVDRAAPILFLDTGKLFEETLQYRTQLSSFLGLSDVRTISPSQPDCLVHDSCGTLWSQNADMCCNLRKTAPLLTALEPFLAQVTGRKRFQTQARSDMSATEFNDGRLRFNPLAGWSREELELYFEEYKLPRHPLARAGYPSIGCRPCSRRVAEGDAYRSGRWPDHKKEECGIHCVQNADFDTVPEPIDATMPMCACD